ncbi:CusA/CzcA family heavy metal efflux RND transporter [Candidatus Aminicenantes bacterium AC-335-K20]|jgi:cobalt-zinc-cadmium resistance protein CzcA|nr:CusA/CzcA family heavy metal efflux RND transporter [SCandidatus Aminicenantes bacterium Aminicenantia_JdfR_composite]MCP2597358.1 CusA/CzcA family heavy metal efflux RND transporter [Candidatus Aminicenantes bacterium AC-335-G13]MCP2597910.1 CusA/CzcA family heavy metal efflux RND transporter [Candidatus Aminicenantes bacterium AC-335-L06]MCP2618985.1 CusA/CzcA family heavy metal efflux RND transporter [Candidatus Aminicenantes bacterium AC-335-A11]MCP2619439.1 CusA/CzcA family heavy metal 
MIDRILEFAIRNRFLIVILGIFLLGYGIYTTLRLPVEAFPDVTNIQVVINTEAPGLAAEEVEKLITFPIESVMNGLPDVTEVRSISKTGLSVVTIVFKDNVDIYFARQLVLERLQVAKERIPEGLGEPEIGPITTGLGQIYQYILEGENYSLMELRAINDWIVKFQLRTVPGVTDVLSFGGEVRQFQVKVDPNELLKYNLTLEEVAEKIKNSNLNVGGWYLSTGPEQLVIRGVGWIRKEEEGLRDIENIVLKAEGGTPIYVKDIAEVNYGPEIRQGAVTKDGKGEVVTGIVLQLKGANTKEVIKRVKKKVKEIQKSLPPGVRIVPYYDQADLVDKAIETITDALKEAAVLIIIVLFLFLGNVRSSIIVVLSIPISMMIAFIMMNRAGLSANLQSLGGLAIGIGMMVDGSVVMVENIYRHLVERRKKGIDHVHLVHEAAREVARPVFFAVLIIVVVFLPLFTLQGVEGKLFSPVAFTISYAMLGSLIVALTIVPVLCIILLKGKLSEKEFFLIRFLKRIYIRILKSALRRRSIVITTAIILLISALASIPFLGTEFVPELEEGTLCIRVTMNPSISLEEAIRIAEKLEKKLLKYPEVTYALSRIGRAELGGDPEPVSNNEIYVGLKPQSEWKTAKNRYELIEILQKDLSEIPGLKFNFSQPIATRVDELISGVRAQIAIKLFGEDLEVLEKKGREIEAVIKTIKGAKDVQMEQISGEAQLVIRVDRDAIAQYGINVSDVMEIVSHAIGGKAVTEVIEGQKRFAVYLRLKEEYRNDIEVIKNLLVASPSGVRVPLAQLAKIQIEEGPPTISRENAQRRVVIQCNVRGRDLGGFVQEAREAVEKKVKLPPGYFIEWGGQFENQQRAQRTLMIVIPLSIFLIFLLLYMSFNSVRHALLIILNVPFALIGGIFSLLISRQYLSVPSSIGFIALFGVAVLNGVVLVSYIRQLRREGLPLEDAIIKGASLRLRPVLMTASVASLGLIPLLLSTGVGSEIQRPLATVVIGGLITSTALTLIVLPCLYGIFEKKTPDIEL